MTGIPFDNIPEELRQHQGWLVWRYEPNPDPAKTKPLKVPYYVSGRRRAGAQGDERDRQGLATFKQAAELVQGSGGRYTGLGFAMLADWGLVGLDFDNCVDAAGAVLPEVAQVIGATYSEVSPSGRGVRAFVQGHLPDKKSHAGPGGPAFGFEVFSSKGFLTITGNVTEAYDLAGAGVLPLGASVEAIFERRFGASARAPKPPRDVGTGLQSILDLGVLSAALQVIADAVNAGKQEMGRNTWRDVLYAVHEATSGSEAGLATAHWFSTMIPDYGPEALNTIWDGADSGKGGGITGASVRHMARKHGWKDPTLTIDTSAFEVIPFDTRPAGEPETCRSTDAVTPVTEEPRRGAQEQPLTSPGAGAGLPADLPLFDRKKSGAILPIFENAVMAIERPDLTGWGAKCDTFRDEVMVLPPGAPDWRPWKASDVGELRVSLKAGGFESCAKEIVRDALVLVAARREYDSAQQWLHSIEPCWDGVRRCESFLVQFWGAKDTPYARAVARYMWTALAGRVINPGCQADMAPVFEGHQGLRKTSGLAALAPDYRLFTEIDLTSNDADLARAMKGVLVCEISELRGLHTRDQESIKAFVSRRFEKWVPKFVEQATTYPRRAVLFGTTNRTDILADETGNRRWLPLHVERVDVEGIVAARDQLWAEAAALYRAGGVDWQEAEALGAAEHEHFTLSDSWEEAIEAWLNSDDGARMAAPSARQGVRGVAGGVAVGVTFTTIDVMSYALGILQRDANIGQQRRVGAILRKLGFRKQKIQTGGGRTFYWLKA